MSKQEQEEEEETSNTTILSMNVSAFVEESKWTKIPHDLLIHVTKFLTLYSDYIHLRSLCKSYHSFLPSTPPHHLPPQLPLLLLPPPFSLTRHHTRHRHFFNIITNKTHTLPYPNTTHHLHRIVGSSNGFLIFIGEYPDDIFTINLVSNMKLHLPPLYTLPFVVNFCISDVGREYSILDNGLGSVYNVNLRQMRDVFVSKIVLSFGSTGVPSIVVGIVNFDLVYCISDGKSWNLVPVSGFSAEDVIFCGSDESFYAVNKAGDVLVLDLKDGCYNNHRAIKSVRSNSSRIVGDLFYLVKCKEDMFLVCRRLSVEVSIVVYCEAYETVGFDVYKFCDVGNDEVVWEKVSDLGDRVVFVGQNSSLVLLASDFPGCIGNRIYFTDDHSKLNDVGFFDFSNGCIESLPCYPHDASLPFQWAPPVWISPNPC